MDIMNKENFERAIKKIELITDLTAVYDMEENYAYYDAFLFYDTERRYVIEVKCRDGEYTLAYFDKKETVLVDTQKLEGLATLSLIHNIPAMIYFETSDGHMIEFKLTNNKGEFQVNMTDRRVQILPKHQHVQQKEPEDIIHLDIHEATVYLFEGDMYEN